ncbi:nitrite extrusion protein 2 [Shigella sonnei]|nr:nitrite extrusion protein 2 [Shigella sonnei]
MTSLKTSIKTITYLSDTGCLEIQGASLMGYEDSDYCARKSRQHTGMKQIGVLHTDPPKWLDNDHPPFEKHMYGVFMHLRY